MGGGVEMGFIPPKPNAMWSVYVVVSRTAFWSDVWASLKVEIFKPMG